MEGGCGDPCGRPSYLDALVPRNGRGGRRRATGTKDAHKGPPVSSTSPASLRRGQRSFINLHNESLQWVKCPQSDHTPGLIFTFRLFIRRQAWIIIRVLREVEGFVEVAELRQAVARRCRR